MSDLSPAQERAVRLALKLAHTNPEMRAMTDQHENQIDTLTAELAEANRKLAAVTPSLITLKGADFTGCSQGGESSGCNCETWTPTECDVCSEEMYDGEAVYTLTRGLPYFGVDDSEQEWTYYIWHVKCDTRAALGGDHELLCPGCGDPVSDRYRRYGVCHNCFGTNDDPGFPRSGGHD